MNDTVRPPRLVPLLYFGTAYVSLALACALAALWPRAVAGFFYHSWMVAIVHLITLGWITCSILGAIYIVGPVALPMPVRRGDYIAYGLVVTGIAGMVAHFWIEEFGGMAWSAATVTAGVLYVVGGSRAISVGTLWRMTRRCTSSSAASTSSSRHRWEFFSASIKCSTSCPGLYSRTCSPTRIWPRSGGRR